MDKDKLKSLLTEAQGNRTQNEFALHCGISSSSITRIKNGEYTPKPKQLEKIAERAHNGVTYNDLMFAAGYLPNDENTHPPTLTNLEMPPELEDVRIAFYGGPSNLSKKSLQDIADFVKFVQERDKNEKK